MSKATEALKRWHEEHQGEPRAPTKTPWERMDEAPNSKQMAIAAFCANCMGWERDGPRPTGIVADIRDCPSTDCPLYRHRPYK